MYVVKRDNRLVEFQASKIKSAILSAFLEVGVEDEGDLSGKIAREIEGIGKKQLNVEEIQDLIEKKLMASKHKDVARAYTNYRYLRQLARQQYDGLWNAIEEKLMADKVENQNANVDEHSFGGRIGEASRVVTKKHALDYMVSPMAKANHENNEIYIHDLDSYSLGMHNCLSIPFDDLLKNGFKTRQTDVRPAGSINTAFQLVAVIFQLQSLQQFGGVSATHLDWSMIPYVRKSFFKHYKDGVKYIAKYPELDYSFHNDLSIDEPDYKAYSQEAYDYAMDMTQRELNQAVEGLYHNLNTLQSRSGNQLPFTSINYGTCTLPEGRMVTKALLNGSLAGVGKHHLTPIFPCGIFQCMNGVNRKPGDPNYDLFKLALESTAKRLYPNYANVDWSGNAGYDVNDPRTYFSTMGCRTANGYDINHEPGQNPQLKDGRGNICPVTIILPTLAMEAEGDVEKFMEILDQKIHEARIMLKERFDWICLQDPSSAKFMYQNGLMYGYKPEEGIRSALKHGTLAIGQLGLAEALQILIDCDHTKEKGMELAKRIEQLFKDRCAEFKEEDKLNFGVYYTPECNIYHLWGLI